VLPLLKIYFPWWWTPKSAYLPWHHDFKSEASATGIIICVGNENIIYATRLVRTLRNISKSSVPIEIAFAGDDNLSPANQALIRSLGPAIELVNLHFLFDDTVTGLSNNLFAIKPFAMLASHFKNFILTDASTIFL